MSTRFGANPRAFFEDVYRTAAPWDIGAPQPGLIRLIEEFPPRPPVIDVGCGTGDLAIELAQRGFETIGVDFVEAAIGHARQRTLTLPPAVRQLVRFEVGDALRPSSRRAAPGSVVDSGFMHLFEQPDRDAFAIDLAAALPPGGRYYVLAFAVTFPIDNAPLQLDGDEMRERFSPEKGWRVLSCRPAEFLSRVATVAATAACVERL